MLLLKRHIGALCLYTAAALAFCPKADAGLAGFTQAHPYTYEEELLKMDVPPLHIDNYREKMRYNLIMLIDYIKQQKPDFQIIAHEGTELLSKSVWESHLEGYNETRAKGETAQDPSFLISRRDSAKISEPQVGSLARRYLNSVDAIAFNNIYCGKSNLPQKFLDKHHIRTIAIDNCPDELELDRAIIRSVMDKRLFYGFSNLSNAFNNINLQPLINETAQNVTGVKDANNILFLLDDNNYGHKYDLIAALRETNYDIVVISPLFHQQTPYTAEEISSLQYKKNGTRRLLIAEMNVSEANALAYYWQRDWKIGNPEWLIRASLANENSAITAYWHPQWQRIMAGYFKSIADSGYDGVFFTGIENHNYFEKQLPLE